MLGSESYEASLRSSRLLVFLFSRNSLEPFFIPGLMLKVERRQGVQKTSCVFHRVWGVVHSQKQSLDPMQGANLPQAFTIQESGCGVEA